MALGFTLLSNHTNGGRRAFARRPRVLAVGLLTAFTMTMRATPADQARVDVSEERGTYQVVATFQVAQRAATAMMVLTDYERIPKFMPDVRTSRVLERRRNRVVVEQEAFARF